MENAKKLLAPFLCNEIGLTFEEAEAELGQSKIGGLPHLPSDFAWPYYEGEEGNNPLSFLAQINLADSSKYDTDNMLPKSGMLYFFYDYVTLTWGYDPKDKGSAKVYYVEAGTPIAPTEFPSDLDRDYILEEVVINFESKVSYPSPFSDLLDDELTDSIEDDVWDELFEQAPATKLLGHPDIIQGDMTFECEAVTSGYYLGDATPDISDDEMANLIKNSKEWVLLLQMGDDEEDGRFNFCDDGKIFYYIKKTDLADKNFDNIWLILQSY